MMREEQAEARPEPAEALAAPPDDDDAEHLRATLREVLAALESLRAMLG